LIEAIKLCKKLNKPTLLDADALFALSKNKKLMASLNSNFILTPHYGEFIRLSGDTKEKLLAEPWDCLQKFLNKKNIIVNLKGSPSMVGTADGQLFINSTGNEGLAKGGSGDVLAGLIGGLMARGMTPHDAAICGNYLHGKAADNLTENFGKTAQTPGDLLTILPTIIKNFEKSFT